MAKQYGLTIANDAKAATFENGFAVVHGYQDQILDVDGETFISNPQTKQQFVNQKIKEFCQNSYIEYRNRDAIATVAAEDNSL